MKGMTQKAWFGKKRVGYGPAPKTWQGWIVTLLFVLTILLDFIYFRISITTIIIFILALIVLFIIASLTGGNQE
jgi:CDP-diglyceride synthetase